MNYKSGFAALSSDFWNTDPIISHLALLGATEPSRLGVSPAGQPSAFVDVDLSRWVIAEIVQIQIISNINHKYLIFMITADLDLQK